MSHTEICRRPGVDRRTPEQRQEESETVRNMDNSDVSNFVGKRQKTKREKGIEEIVSYLRQADERYFDAVLCQAKFIAERHPINRNAAVIGFPRAKD